MKSGDEKDMDREHILDVLGPSGEAILDIMINDAKRAEVELADKATADEATEAAKDAAFVELIVDIVGSEAQYVKMQEWLGTLPQETLSNAAREEYNSMIEAGGTQAQLAINSLYGEYVNSPGFTQTHEGIKPSTPAAPTGIDPISRAEYSVEYGKAHREEGPNSPKLAILDQRRQYTMQNPV